MPKVIVVGGGFAGCGAALAAAKGGAEVALIERTEMLIGVAVRSGETRGNGQFVAQHELRFLGGGELFDALESVKLHEGVKFPDAASHVFIFHTGLAEPLIKRIVNEAGVEVLLERRAMDVKKEGGRILSVKLEGGSWEEGDAFVDCTGSRGGISVCTKYGKGCVLCVVKCVAFGDRVGMVEKAGAKVFDRRRPDGTPGNLAAGLTLLKDTLSPELKERLEREGLIKIPLPSELVDYSKVGSMMAGRSKEFVENLILSDIGPVAKISGILDMSQEQLRSMPGFENVQVEYPQAGKYYHVGLVSIAFRDNSMKVEGIENLFCAGEKAGHSSVDAAIATGYLAGHNAARVAFNQEPLVLPTSLALGDFIAYVTERFETEEGRNKPYIMSRGECWERIQKTGLYTDDLNELRSRVEKTGLLGVLSQKLA
ncbi:FAD-dependent oxidoreductase [Chloroflexota bacterium]